MLYHTDIHRLRVSIFGNLIFIHLAFSNNFGFLLLTTVVAQSPSIPKKINSSDISPVGIIGACLFLMTCAACLLRLLCKRLHEPSVHYQNRDLTTSSLINAETDSNVHPVTASTSGQTQALLPINASQRELEMQGISGYTIEVSPPYTRRVRIQSEPVVHTSRNAGEAQNIATRD